jgi:hypothetical protein
MVRVRAIDLDQTRKIAAWLLGPVAAAVYGFAVWRFATDMNWFDGDFLFTDGFFSRWQVWLVLGVVTQSTARQLTRKRSR